MKILIIRLSSLGDIVLTTPVIRWLKEQQEAEIHYFTKSIYKSILEHHPYISTIHVLKSELSPSIKALKKENFDLIIDLHKNIRSRRVVNALHKLSLSYNKLSFQKWLYLKFDINYLHKSQVTERFLKGLSSLGIKDDGKGLDFYLDPQAALPAALESTNYQVIVAGGAYVTKRIPTNLIQDIVAASKGLSVILGGNDIEEEASVITGDNVINLVGKTSLHESARIISSSQLVVSGDTGLMHIAAAFQKPIVVIWGSTNEEFGYYPYYGTLSNQTYKSISNDRLSCRPCSKYGRDRCPKEHMKCLKDLDVNKILSIISKVST